jgi:hypothetical protein
MTDDLEPWADDDLVRALRATGSATELADEERYVAAFRDAGRSSVRSLPRRAVGRFGVGGTAVVVTVALTSGVAAAYTGHLPDPVQQIAHTVLGAPAPGPAGRHRPQATGASGAHTGAGTTSPSGAPSAAPDSGTASPSAPAATPGASTGAQAPGGNASESATTHTSGPASSTSSSAPASSGVSAAAMSMSAPAHRVGVGQTVTLTGLVSDATGAALPDRTVVLQARGPRRWVRVTEATTDAGGVASVATPAITRSVRFRWKAAPGVTSTPWLVRMVPTVTLSADVGGTSTTLTPVADGATAGDFIRVFKRVAGRVSAVRRGRLDASGTAEIAVRTPLRRATYVVRLAPTRRHTAARARVVVTPPRPASVSVSGSAARVTSGAKAVISGTVTSASGAALPGHTVALMRRGQATRWRRVAHAVTDANGHVSITTPAIWATARFRLRTDHGARSRPWRIVSLPTVQVSAQRGDDSVDLSVTTTGARPGDTVILLRVGAHGLVRLQHTTLAADGRATFSPRARAQRTTYVVRLPATRVHGPARASVTVPGAG